MQHPLPPLNWLAPENELERHLLAQPEFEQGMYWGVPRYGHPEGEVIRHVREVLDNLEAMALSRERRRILRLVALCHDTFKYREEALRRAGQPANHGHLAADFLQAFPVPERVRRLVRWHDEAFYAWRTHLMGDSAGGQQRLSRLYGQLREDWDIFVAFFQADTLTGNKNPAPLRWLAALQANQGLQALEARPDGSRG